MDKNLLQRMRGNYLYQERMILQSYEIGEILSTLDAKNTHRKKDARIKELEVKVEDQQREIDELKSELRDAWEQVLHG